MRYTRRLAGLSQRPRRCARDRPSSRASRSARGRAARRPRPRATGLPSSRSTISSTPSIGLPIGSARRRAAPRAHLVPGADVRLGRPVEVQEARVRDELHERARGTSSGTPRRRRAPRAARRAELLVEPAAQHEQRQDRRHRVPDGDPRLADEPRQLDREDRRSRAGPGTTAAPAHAAAKRSKVERSKWKRRVAREAVARARRRPRARPSRRTRARCGARASRPWARRSSPTCRGCTRACRGRAAPAARVAG